MVNSGCLPELAATVQEHHGNLLKWNSRNFQSDGNFDCQRINGDPRVSETTVDFEGLLYGGTVGCRFKETNCDGKNW